MFFIIGFFPTFFSTQNDHVIFPEQSPKAINDRISKFQFTIEYDETKGIKLTDRSSNGTEVNGNKIGKGKCAMIFNDTIISVGNTKAWVLSINDKAFQMVHPREVRREVTVSCLLGSGAMGDVHLAFRKRDHKRMALKSLKKKFLQEPKNRESFENEANFLKIFKHPNIIRYYSFIDADQQGLYIGLEYADHGDLFHMIQESQGLDESMARFLYYQALKALEYLHDQNVCHRDVKPENLLLCST